MAKTLVIYDVVEDRVRNKVSERCKDYGLVRIQYSAFLGNLSRSRREELFKRLTHDLSDADGRIRIYLLNERDLDQALYLDTSKTRS